MKAGNYAVRALETDHFRLDGGAMFGNVPRALWERSFQPDDHNRIPLTTRVLLLEGEGRRILLDTGCGHLWSKKEQAMFSLTAPAQPGVVLALAELGIRPADVTDVVLTHLHFDHAGGITCRGADGTPEATFPAARVHVQEANWACARDPNERERRSYLRRHWEPLEGPHLVLCQGDAEILPGIWVTRSDGHTEGLQIVRVGEGPGSLVFCADLVPLSTHVSVPWTMGYDLCPRTIMREKRSLLERALAEDWILVFEHDPGTPAARLREDAGRFGLLQRLEIQPEH